MKKLWSCTLAAGRKTDVLLADGIRDLSTQLGSYGRTVLWVFDSNTMKLFRQMPPNNIVIEAGEANKNINNLMHIISSAAAAGLGRDNRIIGFGGGVVCDMAAMAASLYMRGVHLTLVPTTLLCMCDATLGGKTAIDYEGTKNLVGTFYPADDVLICPDVLRTLPAKEWKSGLGEILKHSLLAESTDLMAHMITHRKEIASRDKETVAKMLELSLKVKKSYIEQDPEEKKGIRQMLNLGHTFGHALESMDGFHGFTHGECVAWGTGRALEAGMQLGLTERRWGEGAQKLFSAYGFDMGYRIGRGDWIEFRTRYLRDKKKRDGRVQFVIPEAQGKMKLVPLDEPLVQKLVITQF